MTGSEVSQPTVNAVNIKIQSVMLLELLFSFMLLQERVKKKKKKAMHFFLYCGKP